MRDKIEDLITQSAYHLGDTSLTRSGTDEHHTLTTQYKHCYLRCKKYGKFYPRDKENACNRRAGVKRDYIVNKDTTSRGPTGLSLPRRSQSGKNCKCKFELKLSLEVGKEWFTPKVEKGNCGLNALKNSGQSPKTAM